MNKLIYYTEKTNKQKTVIEYECIGEGRPILFLHGWGMDRRIMSGCFEPIFKDVGLLYRRIYLDLPGMGNSVAEEGIKSSDDILEVLYQFAKDIIGEPFMLAGESYGGYLARGFIYKYPEMVNAMVLLCPLVYPGNRKGRVEHLKVMEQDTEFLKTLTEEERNGFTYMNVVLTKPVWELYQRDILPAIKAQNREFLDNILDGAFSFNVDKLHAPFMNPCLIIVGKQDTEVGYKDQFELMENYPNATYCAINKAGHNLQIEQPKIFKDIVTDWLLNNIIES